MGKNQSASGLINVIQYDSNGNVSIVSGSTTLMQVSSSGQIYTTGTISGSSVQSASLAQNSNLLQGTGSVGFATTGSFSTTSGSVSSRITQIERVYATTGSNSFTANQSITGSLTVSSTLTAQTLVVQTVTSSIVYSSGSNVFGCDINSRQTFTGSFYQTGSVAIFNSCIGIGTNSPVNLLHASSSLPRIIADTSNRYAVFNMYVNGSEKGAVYWDNTDNLLRIQASNISLNHSGISTNYGLYLNSSGNIGIGNCNPRSFLSFPNTTSDKIDFYNDGISRYTAQINANELRFYASATSDVISLYAGNAVGLVNKNGKIAIAHTNAIDVLDVMGSLRIRCNTPDFTAACNSLVIDFVPTAVFGNNPMARYYAIGCAGVSAGHTFVVGVPTAPINAFTVFSDGKVGINTDTCSTATTGAALIIRSSSSNVGQTAMVFQDYRKCNRWAINAQSGANDATLTIYNTPNNTNDYTPAFTIGQNGQITKPQNAAFQATINANTNIGTGGAVIQFNCVLYNAGGGYCGTNSTFTAPVSGLYQFNFVFLNQNTQNTTGGHSFLSTNYGVGTYYFTRYGCNAGVDRTGYGGYVPMFGSFAVYLPVGCKACVAAFWDADGAFSHNSTAWGNFSGYLVG